ncbi:hypothetical protein ACFLVY_01080 [Chloroflexota bacterium]
MANDALLKCRELATIGPHDEWWFYQCGGGVPEDTTGVHSEQDVRALLSHLETIFNNRWYVKHGNTANRGLCANLLLGGVQNTVDNILRLASNISRLGGITRLGRQTRDGLRNVTQCLDTILELEVLSCFAEEGFSLKPYPLLSNGKRPDAKVIVDTTEIFIEITAVDWPRQEDFPGTNWKSKQGSKLIEKSINEVSQLPRGQCGAVVVNPATLFDEEMARAIMEAMRAYLAPDHYTKISGIILANKRIERSGFLKAHPTVLVNAHAHKRCDNELLRLAEALCKHPAKPGAI